MSRPSRRDFIGVTSATVAAVAGSRLGLDLSAQTPAAPSADPLVLELAHEALNVARSGGASYADVRIGRYRRQIIRTRERLVASVTDDESYGLGIRALVDGCWGFAATSVMSQIWLSTLIFIVP
jgi:TldD protein